MAGTALPLRSPSQFLVGAGEVLGGQCSYERKFTGEHAGPDDLREFLCIRTRGCPAAGNAKDIETLVLGVDAVPPPTVPTGSEGSVTAT